MHIRARVSGEGLGVGRTANEASGSTAIAPTASLDQPFLRATLVDERATRLKEKHIRKGDYSIKHTPSTRDSTPVGQRSSRVAVSSPISGTTSLNPSTLKGRSTTRLALRGTIHPSGNPSASQPASIFCPRSQQPLLCARSTKPSSTSVRLTFDDDARRPIRGPTLRSRLFSARFFSLPLFALRRTRHPRAVSVSPLRRP